MIFTDITAGSPYIAQELNLLKKAFNDERAERLRLQASEMQKTLAKLEPIYVPQPKDNRIAELEEELAKLKYVSNFSLYIFIPFVTTRLSFAKIKDWVMSMARGSSFPTPKSPQGNTIKLIQEHQNKQRMLREEIKVSSKPPCENTCPLQAPYIPD